MVEAKVIATGEKGKRFRHYEITADDFEKLKKGEEIFFYQGNEIDIYFKLSPTCKLK